MSDSHTITLPFPDHRLTVNRVRTNPHFRVSLVNEAKELVERDMQVFKAHYNPTLPLFNEDTDLFLVVRCERHKRGQRWDHGGMTEALKPYLDALQGWFYANDRQIVGNVVLWDDKPTGAGLVHLTFMRAAAVLEVAELAR